MTKKAFRPWGLAAALLLGSGPAMAQSFTATAVQASLGPERDEYKTNPEHQTHRQPPLRGAIETEDGRIRVIVQLAEPPLALYEGDVRGLEATRPSATGGRKLNARSASSRAYRSYLAQRQSRFLAELERVAPSSSLLRRFDVVLNGMALAIGRAEIDRVAALPGVARIYPDKLYSTHLDASLPLIDAPAFWSLLGGRDQAGAGVKVAVVDGGLRPENPMFSGAGFAYPPGFPLGDDYCGTVDPTFCNGKIIAARHFRTVALHPLEHDSPLAYNGHGSHVAGIAVGNFVPGADAGDGVPEEISGVAPGAWLMVYKGLWWNGSTGSGSGTDLIAAVDAAVADGADVINNSWGGAGGEDPADDVFGPAFEAAEAAGVLTVASAGNDGPGAGTIGCPGCHEVVLTVANSTTDRLHALGFGLVSPAGGPQDLICLEGTGPALGATVGPQPVIYAGDVGDPEGCSPFPAGSLTGAIALVSRGTCTFATKAVNAAAAGADFMVVFNNVGGAPFLMTGLGATTLSSCMISLDQGEAARDFVQGHPGAQGRIDHPASRRTDDAFEDLLSASSSRGPNGDPDVLKPDVTAPGTRILSAHSPEQVGEDFAFLSGTSMASPHLAGAAALVLQQHPGWTPEQVKTALTSTSVRGLFEADAVTPADPFGHGSGRLDLGRAAAAGATFDRPSMAQDLCLVGCDFTRTLRNELPVPATWTASVEKEAAALGVTVTPAGLTLAPGESAAFTVEVDTALVEQGRWHFAYVVWSEEGGVAPDASLPLAVFAAASSDSLVLSKSVDKAVAPQLDLLTYDIDLANRTFPGTITLTDPIPAGTTFVPGSHSATVNGLPDPGFVYDPGTDRLTWSGQLDVRSLEVVPSPSPFGYVPLSDFFAPLPCSSVCDDTSITLAGLSFDYAGAHYSTLVMSSNGFLVAGDDTSNAFTPFNQELPDPAIPNHVIAPFWTDIDMDGSSATDPGGGIWYAGFLTDGPRTFLVLEWQEVELFGIPGTSFTVQVWIEQGTSNVWFVYAHLPFLPGSLTVGVEDAGGLTGSSRYFDDTGIPPAVGGDLQVAFNPGDLAHFTFQVQAGCELGPVVNLVDVVSGGAAEAAFAVTEIVPGADDDGDGVPDSCSDLCPGTVIPEAVPTAGLRPNRYALVDGDTIFDTVSPPGGGAGHLFTTEETAGCSCEQIIDALGLGPGHRRHGCGAGVMRRWVDEAHP